MCAPGACGGARTAHRGSLEPAGGRPALPASHAGCGAARPARLARGVIDKVHPGAEAGGLGGVMLMAVGQSAVFLDVLDYRS